MFSLIIGSVIKYMQFHRTFNDPNMVLKHKARKITSQKRADNTSVDIQGHYQGLASQQVGITALGLVRTVRATGTRATPQGFMAEG